MEPFSTKVLHDLNLFHRRSQPKSLGFKGGRPGLVVIERDSCAEGCGL